MDEKPKKEGESFEEIAQEANLEDNTETEAEEEFDLDQLDDTEAVKAPRVNYPWLNFKAINLGQDLKNILKNPFWIIMNLLMILILVLFLLLFSDYLQQDQYQKLIGYVATNHKVPDWYHGELPEEAKEMLHHYHEKHQRLIDSKKLIKEDPRMKNPIMGDFYPEELNNDDLILILETQDIGLITRSGAVKTELMNLSGLNLSKISFDEMNNFLQSDLRYTNFEGIYKGNLVFRGASAEFAQFVEAKIAEANFTRARLDSSNFFGARAPRSLFVGAIAPKSLMSDADFSNSKFDQGLFKLSDFSRSNLSHASAKDANFEAASFREANLEKVNFKYSNLKGVNFVNANLKGANLSQCSLEAANFEGADIEGALFNDADLTQANFRKVRNATQEQFQSSKTKIGILNIPKYVFPNQRSFRERFKAPNTPFQ